jgi:hypothetical protein
MIIHTYADSVPPGALPGPWGRRFFLLLALLIVLGSGCANKQTAHAPLLRDPVVAAPKDVVSVARSSMGVPYKFGGRTPETGFDCSGFVCWSYEQIGVQLPRSAREQAGFGIPIRKEDLKPGDIVAFKGTRGRTNWHSGIYTGDGKFIHSPNKGKVVSESSLDERYYAQRYYGACRIPQDGNAEALYSAYMEKERRNATAAGENKKVQVAKSGNGQKNVRKSASSAKPPAKTKAAKSQKDKAKNTAARTAPEAKGKQKES